MVISRRNRATSRVEFHYAQSAELLLKRAASQRRITAEEQRRQAAGLPVAIVLLGGNHKGLNIGGIDYNVDATTWK